MTRISVGAGGGERDEARWVGRDVVVDPFLEGRHASVDSWVVRPGTFGGKAHHPRLDPAGGTVVPHVAHQTAARVKHTEALSLWIETSTQHVFCDVTVIGAVTPVVSHDCNINFLKDLGRAQGNKATTMAIDCHPPARHPAGGSAVEGAVGCCQTDGADVRSEGDRAGEPQQHHVVVYMRALVVVVRMEDHRCDRPAHLVGVR